ncbi:hypothetical protein [Thermococcus zilligii]|uniref:hypothetical protein n=1 Tax=Thermococcus zilligii TaxID=54076 RepID=UPI00029A250F|nr:hypothetical protein [Thermococcus zilligii]
MVISELLNAVPENGTLAIISDGPDSNGDIFGIRLLKELVRRGEYVYVVLYEPFLVFKSALEREGIKLGEVLGERFMIFDAFGSFKGIERNTPYVYQLKGYLDDGVFAAKYRELVRDSLKKLPTDRIWVFTYLSSGACKLLKNPRRTYQQVWCIKGEANELIRDIRAVMVYEKTDCPDIEGFIYAFSDVVVEVVREGAKRKAYITKGLKNAVFNPFEGDGDD